MSITVDVQLLPGSVMAYSRNFDNSSAGIFRNFRALIQSLGYGGNRCPGQCRNLSQSDFFCHESLLCLSVQAQRQRVSYSSYHYSTDTQVQAMAAKKTKDGIGGDLSGAISPRLYHSLRARYCMPHCGIWSA